MVTIFSRSQCFSHRNPISNSTKPKQKMQLSSSKPATSPCLRMAAIFLLLIFTHTLAIRTIPAASSPSPSFYVTPNEDLEVERINKVEQSCEGDIGEEECLMRRTLAAHLDYIYTQKQNP